MNQSQLAHAFDELVAIKYQLYNGLFITLPFENLIDVGNALPVFSELCRSELNKGKSPRQIVQKFFRDIIPTQDFDRQMQILFLILQFVERQVVLFDALEDAAFSQTHDFTETGSLLDFIKRVESEKKLKESYKRLQNYHTRVVLTAHPTQFYPFSVLAIIRDLSEALKKNNIQKIRELLLQLGRTSFKNIKKPTPLDESEILIDYLKHVFYPTIKDLQRRLDQTYMHITPKNRYLPSIFQLGFWPGGDRDGNPNVTSNITLKVGKALRSAIIYTYLNEIKMLKRRLTFPGVGKKLHHIQNRLRSTLRNHKTMYSNVEAFLKNLYELKSQLMTKQRGLFVKKLDSLIITVRSFGFYFATIDIRQNSPIHSKVIEELLEQDLKYRGYNRLNPADKTQLLLRMIKQRSLQLDDSPKNSIIRETLKTFDAIKKIQKTNGEKGCNRYIISHTQDVYQIMEIFLLARWSGWSAQKFSLDIVPLFETVQDLNNAVTVMHELLQIPFYRRHLKQRNNIQIVMLGFSDGTKDGGYIAANWSIFQCKKNLYQLFQKMNVKIVFFDGRGGPPARGGGNTHQFYRALEGVIDQKEIQLTIQGQTISSNFGTIASTRYNMEQLFTSGLLGPLFNKDNYTFTRNEYMLLQDFSDLGYAFYQKLKNHPLFLKYLKIITPVNFYGYLNIASRPPRRKRRGSDRFEDLRAITFVGAFSQIKQNIPGFYGIGYALKKLCDKGKTSALKKLYANSLYFRTLLENAMQSLIKSNFLITEYLNKDKKWGSFWRFLKRESDRSTDMLKHISGQKELLENDPVNQRSIVMREHLVLPLLVIQQYAMMENRKKPRKVFQKIIVKSLAANINASRNSA